MDESQSISDDRDLKATGNSLDDENCVKTDESKNSFEQVANTDSQDEPRAKVTENQPLIQPVDKDGEPELHSPIFEIDPPGEESITTILPEESDLKPPSPSQNTEGGDGSIQSLIIPVVSVIPPTPIPPSPIQEDDQRVQTGGNGSHADQPGIGISSEITQAESRTQQDGAGVVIECGKGVVIEDGTGAVIVDGTGTVIEDGAGAVIEATTLKVDRIDPESTLLNHQAEKQVMQELIDTNVILEREIEKYKADLKEKDSKCLLFEKQIAELNGTISKNQATIKDLEEEKENSYADDDVKKKLHEANNKQKDLQEQLKQLARDDEIKSSRLRTLDTEVDALQKKLAAFSDPANSGNLANYRQHRNPPKSKACVVS